MRARTSGSIEAGPIVATIFVRRCICAARYGVRSRDGSRKHARLAGVRELARRYSPQHFNTSVRGTPSRMAQAGSQPVSKSERSSNGKRSGSSPDSPTDIPKDSWPTILKRTFKQFGEDKLTTWAAALTYFGILSLFPMLLALVSVLGVIGPSAIQPLMDNLATVAPGP